MLEGTPPLLGSEIIAIAPRPPAQRARRSVEQRQVVEGGLLLQQLERRLPAGPGDAPAVLDGRRAVGIAEGYRISTVAEPGGLGSSGLGTETMTMVSQRWRRGEIGRSRTGSRTGPRGVKSHRRSAPGRGVWEWRGPRPRLGAPAVRGEPSAMGRQGGSLMPVTARS